MSEPHPATIQLLQRRAERLGIFLSQKLAGDAPPQQIIDDEMRMVEEAIRQYRAEREIGRN